MREVVWENKKEVSRAGSRKHIISESANKIHFLNVNGLPLTVKTVLLIYNFGQ